PAGSGSHVAARTGTPRATRSSRSGAEVTTGSTRAPAGRSRRENRATIVQSTSARRTRVRVPFDTTWTAAWSGMATTGSTTSRSRASRTMPPPNPSTAVSAEVSSAASPTRRVRPTSTPLVYHLSTTSTREIRRRRRAARSGAVADGDGLDRLEEVMGGADERGGGVGAVEGSERAGGPGDLFACGLEGRLDPTAAADEGEDALDRVVVEGGEVDVGVDDGIVTRRRGEGDGLGGTGHGQRPGEQLAELVAALEAERPQDRQGVDPLDEVVARRLPEDLLGGDDVEHVVDDLEGHAIGLAELGDRVDLGAVELGDDAP